MPYLNKRSLELAPLRPISEGADLSVEPTGAVNIHGLLTTYVGENYTTTCENIEDFSYMNAQDLPVCTF